MLDYQSVSSSKPSSFLGSIVGFYKVYFLEPFIPSILQDGQSTNTEKTKHHNTHLKTMLVKDSCKPIRTNQYNGMLGMFLWFFFTRRFGSSKKWYLCKLISIELRERCKRNCYIHQEILHSLGEMSPTLTFAIFGQGE